MASVDTSEKSKDQQLKELLAAASHDYAHKAYETASDLYAQAAEIQDEINGEMNPANAELLYAYGRCLHHLAVSKSDVLGGKVAGSSEGTTGQKKAGKKRKRGDDGAAGSSTAARGAVAKAEITAPSEEDKVAEKILEKALENKDGTHGVDEGEKQINQETKPFFQISGDDPEWESDDAEGSVDDEAAPDGEAEGEEEEDDDDLATAFEVLDVARVLLQRQIEELQSTESHHKTTATSKADDNTSKMLWAARDRLADTHDLQAEISLENERFTDAVTDARASLALKKKLYDETNGQISEAHFKLSLALEFGSVTTPKDADGTPVEGATQQVDQGMRTEAANEMECAIQTTKKRCEKETAAMQNLSGEELRKKQEEKRDAEELIAEMEQRVSFVI